MLLALNINNTQIKIGGYRGTDLLFHWRIATDREKTDDEYAMILRELFRHIGLQFAQVESVAISCVVPPLTDVFERLCRRYFGVVPLIVGPGVRTGMRIHYENPKEVGADRICNAVAVYEKYGGPAIVVDFGTATHYTVVSAKGEFLGGAIAPGLGISVRALAEHAAQLPHVELVKPGGIIARSTVTAMQAGIIYGFVGQVEEIVRRMKAELGGSATVVATGGWAEVVLEECRCFDHYDPLLTLEGLRIIYERNRVPEAARPPAAPAAPPGRGDASSPAGLPGGEP
ncbi:MAG: type III pantothenate kinase [Armatimonadota bacterium]|nr:type III pantothenate kinase [Armatimonadota bacterium]MDR7451621.1 type III pantothenate kinase [Armatimonadota bacterium]MDR7467659.1 type III pantothenate kinase [Armatimonadota bacterium]MDR7492590.1 type III pantothenate kinase [Armatimonadota bacterium]MDR7499942.1 type III pantothenate kinase [Armatimonadota bacterium]